MQTRTRRKSQSKTEKVRQVAAGVASGVASGVVGVALATELQRETDFSSLPADEQRRLYRNARRHYAEIRNIADRLSIVLRNLRNEIGYVGNDELDLEALQKIRMELKKADLDFDAAVMKLEKGHGVKAEVC